MALVGFLLDLLVCRNLIILLLTILKFVQSRVKGYFSSKLVYTKEDKNEAKKALKMLYSKKVKKVSQKEPVTLATDQKLVTD